MSEPSSRRAHSGLSVRVRSIQAELEPLVESIQNHSLYGRLGSIEQVQFFMEHHVFAVWDFMSLLKSLQADLTCVQAPWRPVGDGAVRRFINEIVLEEESDRVDGECMSHLELYLRAMQQAGASTEAVEALMATANWADVELEAYGSGGRFAAQTWALIDQGSLAGRAGAFAFGREAVIPAMFTGIVKRLESDNPGQLTLFIRYLERHIELDGDDHGPMAFKLLDAVCGSDETAWGDALSAARAALTARLELWDAVSDALSPRPVSGPSGGALRSPVL